MNVTREVIPDLLPVYLSGEASPATRVLIEEYMKHDTELAQRIRVQWADNFKEFHFLLRDYPAEFGICVALGLACWIAYSLSAACAPAPCRFMVTFSNSSGVL